MDFVRLTRLNKPVGIYLLLWPVLWALWIAGEGHPDPSVLTVFVLGVVFMRSAGCIINDLADRNIDPHVKRTRERPLAARRLSPYEALVLFFVLLAGALLLVLQLNPLSVRMSFVGAALAVSYPFMKRFFPLPQFYLGLAFGWGVPMAFAAQLGAVTRVGWLLFVLTVLWAAIYDTFYAMVDREDDLKLGVRSSAILFADMDRIIILAMQVLMLMGLALVGRGQHFGWPYWAGLGLGAALFGYQQWLIRAREPAACFRAFTNNSWFGLAVFAGLAAEFALRN
ncbi:MAG: 4-hydroxybenzoate octaprenyltransferase [Steroidobacteraceae bacterium]